MESFKAVLLSEPPKKFAPSNTVSHYKGVLLCERPSAVSKPSKDIKHEPFVTGKVDGTAGLQPSREKVDALKEAKRNVVHQKEETALTKHLKWLKQKEKEKIDEKQQEEWDKFDKAEKMLKFQDDMQELRRDMIKQTEEKRKPEKLPAVPSKKPPKSKSKSKPLWAMTEDEALDAEFADGRELMQFAEGLDFDTFLNDVDIRAALNAIQEKIEADDSDDEGMEKGRSKDDDDTRSEARSVISRVARSEVSYAGRERQKSLPSSSASVVSHDSDWNISRHARLKINAEAMRLAETLLTNNPNLRAVHSKASLAHVLEELTKRSYMKQNKE